MATVSARVNNVLEQDRGVPLPEGWRVALRCLECLAETRELLPGELPRDVSHAEYSLLGAAKPVAPTTRGLGPGVCVALRVGGNRVNYVLIAHVVGDQWLCHPGSFHGERTVPGAAWCLEMLKRFDVARDAWDEGRDRTKRRAALHPKVEQLQRQVADHADAFNSLVA